MTDQQKNINLMTIHDQDLSREELDLLDIERLNSTDLDMYQCGSEDCKPGHFFGPAVRDHFLIHYIFSGKGHFEVNGEKYHLEAGQGFLICPDVITYYEADDKDPWSYAWIGFHGLKAKTYLKQADLTQDKPIFSDTKENFINSLFQKMITTNQLTKSREVRLTGLVYIFLSELIENAKLKEKDNNQDIQETYAKKAVNFIEKNYSRYITVSEIANYIGLDRSYLWSIFKDYFNLSPQDFLINFRMDKAIELMENDSLSIGDIARSIGYSDPLAFSKTFKKIKGVAPSQYRKNL